MTGGIRVLPAELASQIAAGEVIERPASVVKELIENALDAGARRIEIEIRGGGAELIRVSDDGAGIPAAELELACARHGTSKLRERDDLFRISTLGFRGEALPSIAAVSRFELASRPPDQPAGAWIAFDAGRETGRGRRAQPAGTVVTVRDLFHCVPARRKYLRTPSAEAGAITTLVTTFALAYPEVAFRLQSEGNPVFAAPGTGRLLDAIGRVLGVSAARGMVEIPPANWSDEPGAPEVAGYVGIPPLSRGSRSALLFFVNRRPVTSRSLAYAIQEAYHSLLPEGRYPVAVVNIALPFAEVDVNVHPAKAEVRFQRDRLVFACVQRAVRRAIADHVRVPELTRAATTMRAPAAPTRSDRPETASGAPPPAQPGLGTLAGGGTWHTPGATGEGGDDVESGPDGAGAHAFAADPATGATGGSGRLPPLRVLGQASNLFIVAEGPDGVYLIDQHAAHERITYDRLVRERREGRVATQLLLEPVTVELGPRALAGLEARLDRYRAFGFDVERFGKNAVLVRAVPATLRARDLRAAVAEIVEETAGDGDGGGEGAPGRSGDWEERLLLALACRGSVRGGQALSPAEQRELIAQLERTELPHTCPHGRPVMVLLTQAALERQFGRH